ncbi:MAG: nitronate monooxygenase [Acidimicrobiia bacterium]|nr:nitronate monooxygenase [Acidimicrobiia bacterium]
MAQRVFDNRITRLLNVEIPIANAPMGGVASAELVAAVAECGAIAFVPGSMGPAGARERIRQTRQLTQRPFGVNIPTRFADPGLVDVMLEEEVRCVTTSTGPVGPFIPQLKAAGITVLHVVTSLEEAQRAADAGVDGLIVEGSEAAALRGPKEVATMVLLPLITERVDLPVIAAGGIVDGRSMAAAFALGAEGVLMGTRFIASTEASVHANYKEALVSAAETDTIVINRHNQAPLRVLRTETTERYERTAQGDPFADLIPSMMKLYRDGDMNAAFASAGIGSGRVRDVVPVAEIIARTVSEFRAVIERLALS